jgi:cAMP phosphodiesterase
MTGTVSLNIASAGKYMQALIFKNGSTASYQQIVAEGTNATYTATVDLIDDNDGNDYYELYIRQNTGGSIGLNYSATSLYTRFFGYKLLT